MATMATKILQWNANSLNSLKSATEFKMFVSVNNPDVICIQEMHLKPRQNYYLPGYNIDRRDRLDKRLGCSNNDQKWVIIFHYQLKFHHRSPNCPGTWN